MRAWALHVKPSLQRDPSRADRGCEPWGTESHQIGQFFLFHQGPSPWRFPRLHCNVQVSCRTLSSLSPTNLSVYHRHSPLLSALNVCTGCGSRDLKLLGFCATVQVDWTKPHVLQLLVASRPHWVHAPPLGRPLQISCQLNGRYGSRTVTFWETSRIVLILKPRSRTLAMY